MKRVKCTTKPKAKKIPTRVHRVGKGLSRAQGVAAAKNKDGGDYRGATYDKQSGKATLT